MHTVPKISKSPHKTEPGTAGADARVCVQLLFPYVWPGKQTYVQYICILYSVLGVYCCICSNLCITGSDSFGFLASLSIFVITDNGTLQVSFVQKHKKCITLINKITYKTIIFIPLFLRQI